MRGCKGTCDKCVGPPTCECFVSSTDVLEGAGQPTPSLEACAHTSPLEEVEEEEHVILEEGV